MVELEQKPTQFLTFTIGEKTTQVPLQQTYGAKEVMTTLRGLGMGIHATKVYDLLNQLTESQSNPQNDGRLRYKLSQEEFGTTIDHFIQRRESRDGEKVRPYIIDPTNQTVIELRGISDQTWAIYEPLLNALRKTRRQTESGETQIAPIDYQEVRSLFPKNTSPKQIHMLCYKLKKALAPHGWSIDRQGKGHIKPLQAPWFLRGPADNDIQNKVEPKAKRQANPRDMAVLEQKKRIALEQFDRLAFGTCLLHSCVSILTNPEAKKIFTKNLEQLMSSHLPKGISLQDVIGEKTPEEYFQESIRVAVNSMAGKTYEELSEIQQKIMPRWNLLKKQSGQRPDMVIFERFTSSPVLVFLKDTNHS